MYRIGIIDDVQSERADIQVSILDNVNVGTEVIFKEYDLEHKTREHLLNEIREDFHYHYNSDGEKQNYFS